MRFQLLIALACLYTAISHANEEVSQTSITLKEVILQVLEKNPLLGINDREAAAAAARIRKSQQGTPVDLQIDLENFAGNGNYKSTNQLETSISLTRVLEMGDKRVLRNELAQEKTRLLQDEQASRRLDLLAEATDQFIHVVVDQHRLQIAKQNLTLVQQTYEIVKQRVSAGKSHIAEQRRLVTQVIRAEIEMEHAEHELKTSRLKLSASWGSTHPAFTVAHANLFELPDVADFSELEKLLSNNPDLIRFASEQRIAASQLRLAKSRGNGNIDLSGGVRYFNKTDDAALMLSISMPFGSSSRAQPEIDEMQSLSQLEPLRYEQQRLMLYSSLYEIYQELKHALTAYDMLTQRIIPEAEKAAAEYKQGYTTGRFSLLELNEAQATLLESRQERIMTASKYHKLKIEIERLTGSTLSTGKQL